MCAKGQKKRRISGLPGQENVRCQRQVSHRYSAQSGKLTHRQDSDWVGGGWGETARGGDSSFFIRVKGWGVGSDVFRQAGQGNVNSGEGSARLATARAG